MTILVLLTGLWLQPRGLAPVLVSGALILAVVWVIASRWDILSVLLSLLALLLMGGLLSGWAGKLIHDQPAWFVPKDAVDSGNGLHQGVPPHRLINVKCMKALYIRTR